MRCEKKKKDGKRCRARALTGQQFCSLHSEPGKAAELGSKGGRRRQQTGNSADAELTNVETPKSATSLRDLLAEAVMLVRMKKLDTKIANALAYTGSTLLRAIELSDVEGRLKQLEERFERVDDATS